MQKNCTWTELQDSAWNFPFEEDTGWLFPNWLGSVFRNTPVKTHNLLPGHSKAFLWKQSSSDYSVVNQFSTWSLFFLQQDAKGVKLMIQANLATSVFASLPSQTPLPKLLSATTPVSSELFISWTTHLHKVTYLLQSKLFHSLQVCVSRAKMENPNYLHF